jgi:kinesin family protein 11
MLFLCSQDVYLYFDTFRPLSDEETASKTPVVISCNERRREVAATQVIANKQIDRTFAFDKVITTSSTVT